MHIFTFFALSSIVQKKEAHRNLEAARYGNKKAVNDLTAF